MDTLRNILIIILLSLSGILIAQDTMDQANEQELMAAYMELAQPGKEQQLLSTLEGKWNMEIKAWFSPGEEAMLMTGKAENKMKWELI